MSQHQQAGPEWVAMRLQHEQECRALIHFIETNRQILLRRQEAEREDFFRCAETVKAQVFGRIAQSEQAYWTRKTCDPIQLPDPSPPQLSTPGSQTTTHRPPATSAGTANQKPNTEPAKATATATVQKPVQKVSKQAPLPHYIQQKTKAEAAKVSQPSKPEQSKRNAKPSRRKTRPAKDTESIDLCSSDDDTLVEVSKAAYQKNAPGSAIGLAPFRPSIPTATLDLFGENSRKHMPTSTSIAVKQEKPAVVRPTQGSSQPQLTKIAQPSDNELPTGFKSKNQQDHDAAAVGALSSIASEITVTAAPLQAVPPLSSTSIHSGPRPPGGHKVRSVNVQTQQVYSKPAANRTTEPADKVPSSLQQQKAKCTDFVSKLKKMEAPEPRTNRDGDIDMEDIPLALLNIKAALKSLATKTPGTNSKDMDPALLGHGQRSSNIDVQKTRHPSPSPSLASASAAPTVDETVALLNMFKKQNYPTALGRASDARGRSVESQASSCSFLTAPDTNAPLHRNLSVISQRSSISATSRKRKQIDMSDDEYDYTTLSPSSAIGHKKPVPPLGAPLKRPLKLKDPPSPFASPATPVKKNTEDYGFHTKTTATPPPACSNTPRPSVQQAHLPTPVTPTRSILSAREKACTSPPSKGKAAIRAQLNVQRVFAADQAEDEIFRLSARKSPRGDDKSTSEPRARLRSMSITPVPTESSFRECIVADKSVYTRVKFLEDRAKGEDQLAKRMKNSGTSFREESDEDYEDLDTSCSVR